MGRLRFKSGVTLTSRAVPFSAFKLKIWPVDPITMGLSSSAVSVPPSIDKILNCVGTGPSGLLNVVGAIRTVVNTSSETKPLALEGVLAVT